MPEFSVRDAQDLVDSHHTQQFGVKSATAKALKLAEEVGEVAGAVVRHTERRDGREWVTEAGDECGDVFVALLGLMSKLGLDAEVVFGRSVASFLHRSWDVTKVGDTDG